ncbi:putative ferric-chelate reductase 1 homolog [Bradysia coprophila]|uniref:putative ferric-chelate reductase 1 homolog n=1 Tax=Bradysia coprophila TaxID=38358 RepID=UPI00187DAB82|nr:putative ferric-chelate reductase 1 homolog [Bradysia coprophila]
MMWHSTIFVLIAILHLSTSASLCGTSNEIPIHNNVPPMTTISPFNILTSVSTAHQSEIVTLRIKSILSELKFEGFIVHAFSTSRGEVLGRFTSSRAGLKLGNCDSEDNIATYQAYPGGVDEVELQWQAPSDYVGEILFNATVTQDYDTFWVGIKSNSLEIIENEISTSSAIPSNHNKQFLSKRQAPTSIYEGCGSTKTCVGYPLNCEQNQTCRAVTTARIVDKRFFFELQSSADNVGYVSLGLSRSDQMGDCSVMECLRENGSIYQYNSWNFRRSNTREGVPQNITTLLESSYLDGTIYCKFERDPSSVVLGSEFDLEAERFYFLVAIGTNFSPTAILHHNLGRSASTQPQEIIREVDPIYQGCGTDKICFGMPIGCLNESSCDAVAAVLVENDLYEFELQSEDARAAYVSFALSRDRIMGDDSVMECILQNGTVRAYTSWNVARPDIGNTREGVEQDIIEQINGTYIDGKIYCKIRRDKATHILGHEFNLAWADFHFMLATGTGLVANGIGGHDLNRTVSQETFELPGRRSAAPFVQISAITIVAWLLATSCAHFFRRL